MGLEITVITSVSLVLVAGISAAGSIYAARLNRKVETIKASGHTISQAVHTSNGAPLGTIVENISSKQDEVKRALEDK